MASRATTRGGASALPLNLIAQAVPMLTRHDLEALTERLIDRLDEIDPDSDLEPNGDELDGSLGENDFCPQNLNWKGEPGCPISDPDCAVDDQGCDDINDDREPEEYADEFSDPMARAENCRRIRKRRCFPRWSRYIIRGRREIIGHELLIEPTVPTKQQLLRRKRGVPRRPRA